MINIKDKRNCCGCTACLQICPHNSISMKEDEQGFVYPVVNMESCVDCHLCEKVCPVINQYESKGFPLHCYLAKTKDEELRAKSSSGGVFTELAKNILGEGGVVFGVRFDENWQAIYDYTETEEGLAIFRGSKYLQAIPCQAYRQVQRFLKDGRQVLFTGTPCHVAGLNHFLRKKYDNLITMDIVCHSIPSPKVWKLYLIEKETEKGKKISFVSFRDKSLGWTNYSLRIDFEGSERHNSTIVESHSKNSFMRGMTYDLFTRPSCSECPARNFKSGSDLTVADAWRIDKYHPEKNDEKGLSHILINTKKGHGYIKDLMQRIYCIEIDYKEVEPHSVHAPLTRSCKPSPYRTSFYDRINEGNSITETSDYFIKKEILYIRIRQSIPFRIIRRIFKCFHL